MIRTFGLAGIVFLLLLSGCGRIESDAGPEQTASEEIDAGKAEAVRAEIQMGGGELHLLGGASKLMTGTFRYSEGVGRPIVHYDGTGAHGLLTVESPKKSSSFGKTVNDWNLRMGSALPLDLKVTLGGGTADLDLSKLPLEALEVKLGAGELTLNVAGKYTKDVSMTVDAGAGEARIKLPKDMGVVVDAKVGIGGVEAKGLTKRDGKYFNDAFAEGKPAVHMEVRGGVGTVGLSVE